ncbi:S-methyl-5'-thioadenosine phosphorylase [soil metagenome]
MTSTRRSDIDLAVIGGSGFTALHDDVEVVEVTTPWGPPSGPIQVAEVDGRAVAFLPRHGEGHRFPAHRVPFRANLWALRELGVTRVLGPCASGSLHSDVHPGDLVVVDQAVDHTWGRDSTFFDGPTVNHVSLADPYCPQLRSTLLAAAEDGPLPVHDGGTVTVIQGPRFATRAESRLHRQQGGTIINMTQMPEAALARELGLCYASASLVTDYDTGVEDDPDVSPVTQSQVFAFFEANLPKLHDVLLAALAAIPADRTCGCADAPGGLVPDPPTHEPT